jgi:integrase
MDTSRIKFSWHIVSNRAYLVAYDLRRGELIEPLMDYVTHLSDKEQLNKKTVFNETFFLKSLFEFLPSSASLESITDDLLITFRDEELKKIMARSNSRGDELTGKRTTNLKLRRAYYFLDWCQKIGWLSKGSMGPIGCKITADFSSASHAKPRSSSASRRRVNGKHNLPILFRRVGEGSTNRPRYFATASDREELSEYFRLNGTDFTFARNVLLMDIADIAGWRRGSINSLRCRQFDLDAIGEAGETTIQISPPLQKFGYQKTFGVSFDLAVRVNSFIHTCRNAFLREMGWNEDRAADYLFISARDGRPLSDQAISRIFGRAFKAIGRPQGAGIHSFRRKFANAKVENELRARMRLGLDTSALSVAASVAIDMGQSNPDSLTPYVNRAHSRILAKGADTSDL